MNPATLILKYLVFSVLAGGLGALAMSAVLWGITKTGITKVRMTVAIGSLVTRSYEKAPLVGGLIHAAAGVFFGFGYTYIMVAVAHPGVAINALIGAAIGMLHGLVMSLVLIAAVAEVHPIEEFQQRSFPIALAHWLGHIAYGAVVGAVIGASGLAAIGVA